MNFLERWETVDIAKVETLRLSGLVSISTRGNGSGQVGLVLITGFGVADGKSHNVVGYFTKGDSFRDGRPGGRSFILSFAIAFEKTLDDNRDYRQEQSNGRLL